MAALPKCTDPDDVMITIKAFLSADFPKELIELLEKIIIEPLPFSDNKNLHNLLLLMPIQAEKGKVVGYMTKWRIVMLERLPKLPPITIFMRGHQQFTGNMISMGWLSMFLLSTLLRFFMGIPWVQFSHTVPIPAEAIPMAGTGTY